MMQGQVKTKYQEAKESRIKSTDEILNSTSLKKVVVAGAGTGKTHLFKAILEGKKNTLTLTFINALVEDLSLELFGISDVKTLHGYARSILNKLTKRNIKISPLLSKLIDEDARLILSKETKFEKIISDLDEKNELLPFYIQRKKYYDYYSYSAIIYAAVRYFKDHPEKIPQYEQILVDEFQDFNRLEVAMIDILATKSPILVAGDDDQALYAFKNASPEFIRNRYGEKMKEYASFNLPFCSRCSRVIVEAINDLITKAKDLGYLKERIDKPYKYFDDEEKDKISSIYPKISYTQKFVSQVPWFISKSIEEFALDVKQSFSILIISPYRTQSKQIAEALKKKGFKNVEYVDSDKSDITLLDGMKLLLEDKKCNLGWRIVTQFILDDATFKNLINQTSFDETKKIYDLINITHRKEILNLLSILKDIVKDNEVVEDDLKEAFRQLNIDVNKDAKKTLKMEIDNVDKQKVNPALKKLKVKATTIQSSKGLAADLVFVTHFDDQYFVKDDDKTKITDHEICNVLVALTRTKKKAYLISTVQKEPTFLNWLSSSNIVKIK